VTFFDVNILCGNTSIIIYIFTCAGVSWLRGSPLFGPPPWHYTISSFCTIHVLCSGRLVVTHCPAVSWHAHLLRTLRNLDIRPTWTHVVAVACKVSTSATLSAIYIHRSCAIVLQLFGTVDTTEWSWAQIIERCVV